MRNQPLESRGHEDRRWTGDDVPTAWEQKARRLAFHAAGLGTSVGTSRRGGSAETSCTRFQRIWTGHDGRECARLRRTLPRVCNAAKTHERCNRPRGSHAHRNRSDPEGRQGNASELLVPRERALLVQLHLRAKQRRQTSHRCIVGVVLSALTPGYSSVCYSSRGWARSVT